MNLQNISSKFLHTSKALGGAFAKNEIGADRDMRHFDRRYFHRLTGFFSLFSSFWLLAACSHNKAATDDITVPKMIEVARKVGKTPVFYFWATWCSPCWQIGDNLTHDKELLKLQQNEIYLFKIDVDTEYGKRLKESLKASYLPMMIVFNNDGTERGRIVSSSLFNMTDASQLANRLKEVAETKNPLRKLEEKWNTDGRQGAELAFRIMQEYLLRDEIRQAEQWAAKGLAENTAKERDTHAHILYTLASHYQKKPATFPLALATYDRLISLPGFDEKFYIFSLSEKAKIYFQQGNKNKGIRTLQMMLEVSPDSLPAKKEFIYLCNKNGVLLDRAVSTAIKVLKVKDDAKVREWLTQLYQKKGDLEKPSGDF